METKKHIIAFAVEMGVALLENGAEIYRVEDTMRYILHAHGIKDCHFYVHSSGIFASAGEMEEDSVSFVRDVKHNSVNLARLIRLNQISRMFCKHWISLSEAWDKLTFAKNIPIYDLKYSSLAAGIGCAGFTYIVRGSIPDTLAAFLLGVLLWVWVIKGGEKRIPTMLINYIGSMAATAVSIWLGSFSDQFHEPMIIAGGIMVFVPGVLFSTAVREFLNENFLSGTICLLNSILISAEIAAGVGSMYALHHYLLLKIYL